MSKNYGPNANPGEVRARIWRIQGENANVLAHPGFVPSIVFYEEEAIKLAAPNSEGATERTLRRTREISLTYDSNTVIPLKNPENDAALGTSMTMQEILIALHSLGRYAQTTEDAAEAARAAASNND